MNKNHGAVRQFISNYKHVFIISYFLIYMLWFNYLERTVIKNFTPIYSRLDNYIPFNEIFVIPYFLWFGYIFITGLYFFINSKSDYYKYCTYLFTGMTICLIIYTVWPNGHYLRVDLDSLERNNIFIDIISKLYSIDTSTNVFPSIHVFNSIGAFIAIHKNERLKKIKWIQLSSFVLSILICLSTVFIKQHSIIDVMGGIILSIIVYIVIYLPDWGKEAKKASHELSQVS